MTYKMGDSPNPIWIPPGGGPAFIGHTYMNPVRGTSIGQAPHIHPMVGTEFWVIFGAAIDELVPPAFAPSVREFHEFGEERDGGEGLNAPSQNPDGPRDMSPIMLRGTEYEDDLKGLQEYIRAALPEASMLRCIYHSDADTTATIGDDSAMVELPARLDASTPEASCTRVAVGEGEPVTILAFYESSGLDGYYWMHTNLISNQVFDEDPFV